MTTFAIVANGKNFGFSGAKSASDQIENAKNPQDGVTKNKSVANKFDDKSKDKIVPKELARYANVVTQSKPPRSPPHVPFAPRSRETFSASEVLFCPPLIFRPPVSGVCASR